MSLKEFNGLIALMEKRNELLDEIVRIANKREGQHVLEITSAIRKLCDELDSLCRFNT